MATLASSVVASSCPILASTKAGRHVAVATCTTSSLPATQACRLCCQLNHPTAPPHAHRRHNDAACPLLALPDGALGIIARKMGKRARLLCSRLRSAYGSPGAVLCPPAESAGASGECEDLVPLPPSVASALRSWHHPQAVRRLVLAGIILDGPACRTIAEALPALRELRCGDLDAACNNASEAPPVHTSLTRLHVAQHDRDDLLPLATFAPRLQALDISRIKAPTPPQELWGALASLRSLRSLDLPLHCRHLVDAASLPRALQQLTGLTRLGLDIIDGAVDGGLAAEDAAVFTLAAAGLPQLASVRMVDFRALGRPLGPALQAMALTRLELEEVDVANEDFVPSLAGCFPDLSAMPRLQHLKLSGAAVVASGELLQACRGGSRSLRALELHALAWDVLPEACAVISHLPGLTMLSLEAEDWRLGLRDEASCDGHYQLLSHALSLHPQLLHLEVTAEVHGFVPCLTALTALTCLQLRFELTGVAESELAVVGSLTGLKTLALGNVREFGRLCMEVVRKLPLLEDVQLGDDLWECAGLLELLVPPPAQLKSIRGLAKPGPSSTPADLAVVEQLSRYGVDVE
jgi:hypothetical protein